MASVPNRTYPMQEFNEIDTIVTKHNVIGGRIVYQGFLASGSIQQYQPVIPAYYDNTTSHLYVYGSITEGTLAIGVSDAAYTVGQNVGVIVSGPVTMHTSGSSVSALGKLVMQTLSGSTSYAYVKDFTTSASGNASGSLGWCIWTGSGGANADVIVFISPGA